MNDISPQSLHEWDRTHYWHSFTQMAEYEPLVIERADGVWLFDTKGRKLLDGASSMWCNVHGHNHPKINAAISEQLGKVAHATSLGMSCDTTIQFAKRLVDITPDGLEHVFFSSDGSSAIEVALKAAFQYWTQCDTPQPAKTKFLAFGQAYHGDTLGAASVGGIAEFRGLFAPLLLDVLQAPQPNGRTNDAAFYLEAVEKILQQQSKQIAAMVIEPLVQGAAGMVMQPAGFVKGLRELADRYDVLLILDEVATGFGRTGALFACQREQVLPDFLCLGKGITGGYLPMSATLTTPRIWKAFLGDAASGRALYHGHTYSGNPLAAAAGLASLNLFEEEKTIANLAPKIERLGERLAELAESPHVAHPRQCGMIVAVDLVANQQTGEPFSKEARVGRRVAHAALERGVWLRARNDMTYALPPLSITLTEIDILMDAMTVGVESLQR